MKQKLMVVLLAVLIACGFAGCAGETRQPGAAGQNRDGLRRSVFCGVHGSTGRGGLRRHRLLVFADRSRQHAVPGFHRLPRRRRNATDVQRCAPVGERSVGLLGEGDVESMKTLLLEEAVRISGFFVKIQIKEDRTIFCENAFFRLQKVVRFFIIELYGQIGSPIQEIVCSCTAVRRRACCAGKGS